MPAREADENQPIRLGSLEMRRYMIHLHPNLRQKTGTSTDGSDLSSQPEGHGFEPRFGKSERQASIHSGDKVESLKHVDRN